MDSEQDKMAKTAHNKIFIAPPMQIDLEKFYTDLQRLRRNLPGTTTTMSSTFCRRWSRPTTPTAACALTTRCGRHRQHRAFLPEEIAQKLQETEHPAEEG